MSSKKVIIDFNKYSYHIYIWTFSLISASLLASWPVDTEPYGFLGCKILRFRGFWEEIIDSSNLEERTEGSCIAVALANIMLYNRWPPESRFDGIFLNSAYDGVVKRIRHKWNYDIILGSQGIDDCETDDPETRSLADNPSWNGKDEIHELVYAVERSFGFDHEYFKTKDKACDQTGNYPIEHVLRNRFGYPSCRTIPMGRPETRKRVIRNLKNRIPVIGMQCGHVYILDGYKVDKKTGKALFHSSDYIMGQESMGWFPWKYFIKEGLERLVVDIDPDYRLLKGPSSGKITYYWGEGFIPATYNTIRKGRIRITSTDGHDRLGSLEVKLCLEDVSFYISESNEPFEHTDGKGSIFYFKGQIPQSSFTIPQDGFFSFGIREKTKVILTIKNNDKVSKTMRIVFRDFTDDLNW